jgi:hypothetical protein
VPAANHSFLRSPIYRDAIIRVDYPEIGAAHIVNSVKIQFMNFGTQATLAEKLVLR